MTVLDFNDSVRRFNRQLRPVLAQELTTYLRTYPEDADAVSVMEFLMKEENLFGRDARAGHITCSAWVVDPTRSRAVLVRHRRLGRWVQPGGHIEPFETPFEGACREAGEETGLKRLIPAGKHIFHVSVHNFPEGKDGPAHLHYDLRYLFFAVETALDASPETEGALWVELDRIAEYTEEATILVMADKTAAWSGPSLDELMRNHR